MKTGLWLLLVLTLLAQWALPAAQIIESERVLVQGHRYYLRTAPVDPVDAFRGRYVALDFPDARALPAPGLTLAIDDTVYLPLRTGDDRYAVLGPAQRQPPAQGDYLRARVRLRNDDGSFSVSLPFDRYYLREQDAPRVEQAYREASRNGGAGAYVAVRVRGGRALLEELYIAGEPAHARAP